MNVEIRPAPSAFSDWESLLAILHAAFAYQHDRIDPPSSLLKLDVASIAVKAQDEQLFIAQRADELVGCVFARHQPSSLYVGKLAVKPDLQGQGIGGRLMQAVETYATQQGFSSLELDTRIELTENHDTFAALGFVKTADNAHEGYNRTTYITMQKLVASPASGQASTTSLTGDET